MPSTRPAFTRAGGYPDGNNIEAVFREG